jgi:hypothetical protein
VYAPPGQDPDLNTWNTELDAGEPYQEAIAGPIADAVTTYRSGYYLLDLEGGAVAPAPTLFNSGWADDIFPVTEPLRWIRRAKALHPGVIAEIVASDYGHARASGVDAAYAKSTAREWFDHYLKAIGRLPGPRCARGRRAARVARPPRLPGATWAGLAPGEVRLQSTAGGTSCRRAARAAARRRRSIRSRAAIRARASRDESVPRHARARLPAPGGSWLHRARLADRDRAIAVDRETSRAHRSPRGSSTWTPTATSMLVARGIYRPTIDGARRCSSSRRWASTSSPITTCSSS